MTSTRILRGATALATLALALPMLPSAVAQEADDAGIEEVVVTGSFIRRPNQADSPSPLQVIGSEDLTAIGASTIRDLTNTLTINAGSQNNPDAFTQNRTPGTENFNLRGLGVQSTLVLLNSKRQVSSAAPTDDGLLFVDTASLVPLIAIERVEILKDGASAIYGTDAVAGVVNFITRDDFEGAEIEFDYQTTVNGGALAADYRVSGIVGGGNDRGHVTLSFSYLDRASQTFASREFRPPEFFDPSTFGPDFAGDILSVSSISAYPANFVFPVAVPFAPSAPAGIDPAISLSSGTVASEFDQNSATFFFPGAAPADLAAAGLATAIPGGFVSPLPVVGPSVGTFSGFAPFADGVSDALTGVGLSAGFAGLVPEGLEGAFAEQLEAIALAVGQAAQAAQFAGEFTPFATPAVPDPGCLTAGEDNAVFLPPSAGSPDGTVVSPFGQCAFDFLGANSIIPEETRLQGFAQATYDITDQIEFYGEFGYARNRAERPTTNLPVSPPTIGPLNPFTLSTFGVATPLTFVGRTFGAAQVDDPLSNDPNPIFTENDTLRVQAGLRGEVVSDWYFDVSVLRAFNEYEFVVSDTLLDNLGLAINGLGGEGCNPLTDTPGLGDCSFFNPFASGITGVDAFGNTETPLLDQTTGAPILNPDGTPVTVPFLNTTGDGGIIDFITGELGIEARSDITVVDAVVSGTLFDLPGGPLQLAAGYQFRREGLSQDVTDDGNNARFNVTPIPLTDFGVARDVNAVFGEISVPFFDNDRFGKLEVSAAVRYEDTEGVGDTVDPRVAVLYKPVDWVSLRGGYSTSFRSPSIFQNFGNLVFFNSVSDPLTGQAPFLPIFASGDEDIEPETSRQFNVGISLTPDWLLPGLDISFDFWDFEFENVIIPIEPQTLVNLNSIGVSDEDLPGELTAVNRGITGGLSNIVTEFTNSAFIETNGFDFHAGYRFDTDFGTFATNFDGTFIIDYVIPTSLVDPTPISVVDNRNFLTGFANPTPNLRWNWGLNWFLGGHNANVFVRYIDSYEDDENCATSEVLDGQLGGAFDGQTFAGSSAFLAAAGIGCADFEDIDEFVTVDAQYSYTVGDVGPFSGVTFTAGVINAFDRDPPFVETDGGFDSRTHDPRGRLVYARMKVAF